MVSDPNAAKAHNATQAEYIRLVALAKAGPEIPPAVRFVFLEV